MKDNKKKRFETSRIYFIWLQWQPRCFNSKQSVSCSRVTYKRYLFRFFYALYIYIYYNMNSARKIKSQIDHLQFKKKRRKISDRIFVFCFSFFICYVMLIHWILSIFKEELNRRYIYHLYYNFIFYKNFSYLNLTS